MNELKIKNARVVDPSQNLDCVRDVFVRGGVFADAVSASAAEIDAKGLLLVPGFVDMHAHLREPGQTSKECVATATAAAAGLPPSWRCPTRFRRRIRRRQSG